MKKIVALVLCLALALALCTTAFAATVTGDVTKSTLKADDKYVIKTIENAAVEAYKDKDILKSVHGDDISSTGVVTKYADMYIVDGDGSADAFYEVSFAIADHTLYKDGNIVCYLKLVKDRSHAVKSKDVATSAVAGADEASDLECGNYVVDNSAKALDPADVYVIGGVAYVDGDESKSDTDKWAVYNGKFVLYGGKAQAVKHTWTGATLTYDKVDGKKVVGITCKECKNLFSVVGSLPEGYTGTADVNYEKVGTEIVGANGKVAVGKFIMLTAATTSTGSASTTVESAKTFDAGIALYAGMALASVAGSAVVIGKKKEF